MTPLTSYQQQIDAGTLTQDPAQKAVMEQLEAIYQSLMRPSKFERIRSVLSLRNRPPTGLYLWGTVGSGKTHLIDTFYACVNTPKIRMHFHDFMRMIHQQLHVHQGIENPIALVAHDLAKRAKLICFDEFYVNDITDAMLLGSLFRALFQEGLCLVTTSNTDLHLLYENGIQRERFTPAIELIAQHVQVRQLSAAQDYRNRHPDMAAVYFTPMNDDAHQQLAKLFTLYAGDEKIETSPLVVLDRPIDIIQRTESVLWVDFTAACSRPRSQHDYLSLAESFHTIILSDIPLLSGISRDQCYSFIYLIDILYDQQKRLILSMAAPLEALFDVRDDSIPLERTYSRLVEMQSQDYALNQAIKTSPDSP